VESLCVRILKPLPEERTEDISKGVGKSSKIEGNGPARRNGEVVMGRKGLDLV
jgi:hypothetical protein